MKVYSLRDLEVLIDQADMLGIELYNNMKCADLEELINNKLLGWFENKTK